MTDIFYSAFIHEPRAICATNKLQIDTNIVCLLPCLAQPIGQEVETFIKCSHQWRGQRIDQVLLPGVLHYNQKLEPTVIYSRTPIMQTPWDHHCVSGIKEASIFRKLLVYFR